MNVEDVFCSKVRMKVLVLLFRFGQMHTSAVAERLGASYGQALSHLEFLEREGVVEHRLSGRTKYFRFTNSVKALATIRIVEEWENKETQSDRRLSR